MVERRPVTAPDDTDGGSYGPSGAIALVLALQAFPWVGIWRVLQVNDRVALGAAVVFLFAYSVPTYFVWRAVVPAARTGSTHLMLLIVAMGLNMLIVPFASVYWQLSANATRCFSEPLSRIDAMYFTLTTLTTTGFGDIQALSELCRMAVFLQMVAGAVILIGVLAIALHYYASARSRPVAKDVR